MSSALATSNAVYGAGAVAGILESAGEGERTGDAPSAGTIYVGSRKSKLALWQTEHVVGLLREAHPSIRFEITTESTHGDNGACLSHTRGPSPRVAPLLAARLPPAFAQARRSAGRTARCSSASARTSTRWSRS